MPRGEIFVQLVVDYADDEKLVDVSRSARLLYVDAVCKSKAAKNDGVLTPGQVDRLMYPESRAAAKRAANELVDSGAWLWDEGRKAYVVAAFLKRNKSRAQLEADRLAAEESAALGNHKRWHVERNRADPKCHLCREEPSPPRSGTRSSSRSGAANRTESPETETETETEKNKNPPTPRAVRRPPEPPEDRDLGEPGQAEGIVATWIQSCHRRPPRRVIEDVGRLVLEMLGDGTDPGDIEHGIRIWQAKGSNPRTLPSFVNQVMNARPTNVLALPDRRPSTTDQRVGVAVELAAKYAQEDLA
jgi:hypothetical protein